MITAFVLWTFEFYGRDPHRDGICVVVSGDVGQYVINNGMSIFDGTASVYSPFIDYSQSFGLYKCMESVTVFVDSMITDFESNPRVEIAANDDTTPQRSCCVDDC